MSNRQEQKAEQPVGEALWAPGEIADITARLAGGEDVVSRIVTMKYFTYKIEGEEVIFMDEMRAEVETLAGAPLVEATSEAYPMERVLRFAPEDRAGVLARLGG